MNLFKHIFLIALLFLTFNTGISFCEETTPPAAMDAKVMEIIQKSMKFSDGIKSYKYSQDCITKISFGEMKQDVTIKLETTFQKPNKLKMHTEAPFISLDVICDGTQIVTSVPQLKKYAVKEAPKDFADLQQEFAQSKLQSSPMGNLSILQKLLWNNDEKEIFKILTKGQYIQDESIEDVTCSHIRLGVADAGEIDIWFKCGDKTVPYKIVPDAAKLMAALKLPMSDKMKMELTILFKNWEFDQEYPAETFKFTPADESQKVEENQLFPSFGAK